MPTKTSQLKRDEAIIPTNRQHRCAIHQSKLAGLYANTRKKLDATEMFDKSTQ